jgi:PBP1b-binding outer membrane lipoprotein LpoB
MRYLLIVFITLAAVGCSKPTADPAPETTADAVDLADDATATDAPDAVSPVDAPEGVTP